MHLIMKKSITIFMLSALVLTGCNKELSNEATIPAGYTEQGDQTNFEQQFGVKIDPQQDWNSITTGEVSITANANLNDIVKVQILTESPFLNNEARVLNEASVQKGATVTLTYSTPNYYKQLVAACVDSKGVYYIQVFNVGQSAVSFPQTQAQASRRALASEAPTFDKIKLQASKKSLNAQRAASDDSRYSAWDNSNWNDDMWAPADGQTFNNGWHMDSESNRGVIFRDLDGFAEGEQANVEAIINSFFVKYTDKENQIKKNNIGVVRNSTYLVSTNNYFETDGVNPVTLIPIQAYTIQFKLNHIFYYYYKPEDIPAGMSEVDYIKQLPKFKAIQVERVQTTPEMEAGAFYRRQEFLLPFYQGTPAAGYTAASPIFPAGYKVGFLNQKCQSGTDITNKEYGCTYGDGRLNQEVNLWGSFKNALDKSLGGNVEGGMNLTDPRIVTFTANGKTYMCFEEGVDCNFSDMVIEIGGGLNMIEETPRPEAEAYTMCFEDRPQIADYDMNDVVLRATRLNETQIQLSIIACGAYDPIVLGGIQGTEEKGFNGKEVHQLFGYSYGEQVFINTVKDAEYKTPITETVTVDKNLRIDDFLKAIYIENRATGQTIKVAGQGEAPYAIVVPISFRYPLEKKSITAAYSEFLIWAADRMKSRDWFLYWDEDLVYPDKFSNQ